MWIARERIVPVVPRPAWLCYAGLGVALGAVMAPLVYYGAYALMRHAGESGGRGAAETAAILLLILSIAIGLSPLYILPALYRVTQRWGAVLGFAAAFIGTMWLVLEGGKVLSRADGGYRVGDWLTRDLLVVAGAEVGGYIVLAAVLRVVCRMFVRVREHRPGECAACGYTLGSELITRCPECGWDVTPLKYRAHRFVTGTSTLAARGSALAVVSIVVLAGLAIAPVWSRTIPAARFYAMFPDERNKPIPWSWMTGASALSAGGAYEVPAAWVPTGPPSSGRGVYVLYAPGQGLSCPMIVGISGGPKVGMPMGSMRVTADLSDDQADYVLRHGLPEGLIQALNAQADEVAWTPESTPRGQKSVEPAPYFPSQ